MDFETPDWSGTAAAAIEGMGGVGDAADTFQSSFVPMNFEAPQTSWWNDLGSDFKSGMQSFGNFAKAVTPFAQLGATGMGIYSGVKNAQSLADQTKIQQRSADTQERLAGQAEAAAAPVSAYSADRLGMAQRGEVPPAVQAEIDQWLQQARQRWYDYLARSGQGDSQARVQIDAYLDQQAAAFKSQYLRDLEQAGVNAAGTAGGILAGAANTNARVGAGAAQQQGGLAQLIAAANQQLAQMAA